METVTALAGNFIYGGSNAGGGGGTIVYQGVDDGTLAGTILSVFDSGTIGSNLTVGQSLSAGVLSVGSYGSFGGDLFIGGTLTGAAIGSPPSPYTQYPAPPGLLPSDTVSEALYKISQEFQFVNEEPPPDPNANGDLMLNLRDIHLVLDVPGYLIACIAASTLTVNDLITQTSPCTKQLSFIYDGATGTLTATLQTSGSQSGIGSLVLDGIPCGRLDDRPKPRGVQQGPVLPGRQPAGEPVRVRRRRHCPCTAAHTGSRGVRLPGRTLQDRSHQPRHISHRRLNTGECHRVSERHLRHVDQVCLLAY